MRWEDEDAEKLARIRRSFPHVRDDHLRTIVTRLARPEICAPDTYHELLRTPRAQERLRALGLVKKPVTQREKLRVERESTFSSLTPEIPYSFAPLDGLRPDLLVERWPIVAAHQPRYFLTVLPSAEHSRPTVRLLSARTRWHGGEKAGVAESRLRRASVCDVATSRWAAQFRDYP